jgi:hypothetical protein
MSKPRVLAFDIGIKNLAYCILDGPTGDIIALENCNLLAPDAATATPVTCSKCKAKATYSSKEGATCKRHIPGDLKPLQTPDGKVCRKIPTVPVLRTIVREAGLALGGAGAGAGSGSGGGAAKREDWLQLVSCKFALPLEVVKAPKAAEQSLASLHDALRRFAAERWLQFRVCNVVLLENQPAFKNPHMKSVQVLLFAVLRELFLQEKDRGLGCGATQPLPVISLVHAKKKVKDVEAAAGDAGYKARKEGSEARLRALFADGTVKGADALAFWSAAKKKSDMADALCMCVDYLSK